MSLAIGFTGSRTALIIPQNIWVTKRLKELYESDVEFHHGDCIGKDESVHRLAKNLGYKIVIHPPKNNVLRAYCKGDEWRDPLPYIERNHEIVDETTVLLAIPDVPEVMRSGTWATIRYARKLKRKIIVWGSD